MHTRLRAKAWALSLLVAASGALAAGPGSGAATPGGLGSTPAPELIEAWNIDIAPDGENLPPGSGSVAEGERIFAQQCAVCHGEDGTGGQMDRLVGGQGTLASDKPVKTVGSYWPYATTLFDYIHRAMPFPNPQSLSADQVYAVSAYILHLNGIVPADAVMDRQTLPQVRMPNRDGFTQTDTRTLAEVEACMSDCTPLQVKEPPGPTPEMIREPQVQ